MASVTERSHPTLWSTLMAVAYDSGAYNRLNPQPESVDLDFEPGVLQIVDFELWQLSPEDRDTFAIGEQSEMEAISQRSSGLKMAHEVLTSFFNSM